MRKAVSLLLLTVALVGASCTKDPEQTTVGGTSMQVSETESTRSQIPYATEEELAQFAGDKSIADYALSRKMALMELSMSSFNETMGWHGTKLSEVPVIVYDYDSKPKYYEFIVMTTAGDPIGTVTAYAKPETETSLAYVLPEVRDYEVITKGGNLKMFKGEYPHTFLGIPSKSGDAPVGLIDEEGNAIAEVPLSDEADAAIARINAYTDEEFAEAYGEETDKATEINRIIEENQIIAENAAVYWEAASDMEADLATVTDEEIIEAINDSKGFYTTYSEHIIPFLNNDTLKRTRWAGWCGPSVLAWIYRGYFRSYNGTNLPLHGTLTTLPGAYDNDGRVKSAYYSYYNFYGPNDHKSSWYSAQSAKIDGGLYRDLANACKIEKGVIGIKGATTPKNLRNAMNSVSGGMLYMKITTNHTDHLWNDDPVVSLTEHLQHYSVAIGIKEGYLHWEWTFKLFGKKHRWYTYHGKSGEWLYVMDNGHLIKNNGYYPYWDHKYPNWNPKYVVIQN